MYRFESLYPCTRVTIEDGALAIGGIFTERRNERSPIVLIARVSGARAHRPMGYEVSLVRMAADTERVWQDSLEFVPPAGGYKPVELATLIRGSESL